MLIVAGEIRMQAGTRDQFFTAVRPMVAASLLEPAAAAPTRSHPTPTTTT